MSDKGKLSEKAVMVLKSIAEGQSYAQIVDNNPDISYIDIFNAAREALELIELKPDYHDKIASIKAEYPNAYEKWTDKDDEDLILLFEQDKSISELAEHFKRQPSAIGSRLKKLGLMD